MTPMASHLITLDAVQATHTVKTRPKAARLERRNLLDVETMTRYLDPVDMVEDEVEEMRRRLGRMEVLTVEAEMIGMRLPLDPMGDLNAVVETRILMDRILIPMVVSKVADRVGAITITRLTLLSLTNFLALRSLYLSRYLFICM